VLIDDSVVRGTTSVKIVQMMREAGAKEVHMRISSPPDHPSDFYGIDTPDQDKLLAATKTSSRCAPLCAPTSLAFLSVEGIYKAMGYEGRDSAHPQFTDHCFTGEYPTGSGTVKVRRSRSSSPSSPRSVDRQRLKDRIALITGASRGLGRALLSPSRAKGAHVLLLARGMTMLGRVDDDIGGGGTASLIPLDLTDGKPSTRSALAL
jgi:hypothetical protein